MPHRPPGPRPARVARLAVAALLTVASATPILAQARPAAGAAAGAGAERASGPQPYATVVPASARTDRGMFDVHRVGERLLFEIPDSLLGRDMALMSRYASAQDGLADGGANMAPNLVVRWERRDDRIVLRAVSHQTSADSGSAMSIAVANSNFAPVLQAYPIRARNGGAGRGASVIDVTDSYTTDVPTFTLPRNRRGPLGVRSYDAGRSWLEWARTFPINVEVRVVQTYAADQPPSNARGGTVSFEVNHSMVLLPKEPMRPRHWDERVGFSAIEHTNYSSEFQGVRPERYVRRFRLEPKDTAAFLRGELVEPVNPWVWYIDPATPPEWVPYMEAGILEWNEAFELAGFKGAVQARVAPTEAEDSTFSLLDARYSVLRWVASPTRSANSGGDVVDPRSGEVIRAHTNMYHAVQERMRWQLLSQVATADPRFRTSRLSQEDMGEALRYVVSHETAHSVGLPHNQRANFVFPVDSIRNPDFVRRMGHSGSSVGRTRFNYAAQPGDSVPPERRIGLWDKFAVLWGYRPVIGDEAAERDSLNRWVVERADKPWFRFASAQFGMDEEWDPYRMTEGISDDPVEAAVLGMRNLRVATDSLMAWVLEPGEDHYELEAHYLQNLTQWNRYAEHAAAAVGGSWTHHKRVGEPGAVYTPIEPEYQRKAMRFIDEHVLRTPAWALDATLLRRLEHAGAVERIRAYQELAVQRLLNAARLSRMIEHEAFLGDATYRPAQMLDDARTIVWRELGAGAPIDTYRRNLQRAYLQQAHHLLHEADTTHWSPPPSGNLRVGSDDDPTLNGPLHVAQSDVRPLVRDQLVRLKSEIETALRGRDVERMTRIHLEDALVRIGKSLGS